VECHRFALAARTVSAVAQAVSVPNQRSVSVLQENMAETAPASALGPNSPRSVKVGHGLPPAAAR
jgi:hypothetical protein